MKKSDNDNILSQTDVMLIVPPSFEEGTLNAQPIPIGLISMHRVLNQANFWTEILNLSNAEDWNEVNDILITHGIPKVVGISCFTRQRFSAVKVSELVKKLSPDTTVIIGGPHASFLDKQILIRHPSVDYIIRGEGEYTFLDLVCHILCNTNVKTQLIPGISYIDENAMFVRTANRTPIDDLSGLPPPLLTDEELSYLLLSDSLKFHFPKYKNGNIQIAPIITSRGCDGNCTFCCNRAFWGNNRCAGVEYAYRQFSNYYNRNITFFDIYDDNFTSNMHHVNQLCDLLIDNRLLVNWWCSSRVDTIDIKLLRKMKQAGCFLISFGAESGSQVILDNINKGIKVEDIENACSMARDAGLSFRLTISIGHLGETDTTINSTIELINRTCPNQVAIFLLKVYPGTPIYNFCTAKQLLSDDYWFDSASPSVPIFTYEHTQDVLLSFRNRIINGIKAHVINTYEDELFSIELDLSWD